MAQADACARVGCRMDIRSARSLKEDKLLYVAFDDVEHEILVADA
jgi:hypothetical protein